MVAVRLDQDCRRAGQDEVPRSRPRRMGLHFRGGGLQSGAVAEADGRVAMSAASNCRLIARWRIVEADLWDRGYLDTVEPVTIAIGADGHGEIAFGVLQASLDLGYSPSMVFFSWVGCDEMDEVTGDGHAKLLDDGTSRSLSPITMATRPSSKPSRRLLQPPANILQGNNFIADNINI